MLHNIRKIAILRALQLGDLLCTVPAFRALRAAYPEAEITLLGLPWAAGLVARYPQYLDRFLHFPGAEGLPEQSPGNFEAFAEQMRAERFDLILQLQGNGSIVNDLLPALGGDQNAGFWTPPAECPNPLSFIQYPGHLHEIHRHLGLLQYLGIPLQGDHLEFPIMPSDEAGMAKLPFRPAFRQYVCIHPGSRDSRRQWPPSRFAALGDALAESGWQIVLTGTNTEKRITEEVMVRMKQPATDLAGWTSLGTMAVLLNRARLLVGNCTGTAHLSYALRTPSVIISMDGEPQRWGPLNTSLHRQFDWTKSQDQDEVIAAAIAMAR